MSAGHVCLYHTFSRELVLEPQLEWTRISTHGFLHGRAQRESKGPYCMRLSAWIHTSRHAHLQVGLMSAGHVCLSPTFSSKLELNFGILRITQSAQVGMTSQS